jgi:hypothetical protein
LRKFSSDFKMTLLVSIVFSVLPHMNQYSDCRRVTGNLLIYHRRSDCSWQRATTVVVGWFAGRTWKNNCKWHT